MSYRAGSGVSAGRLSACTRANCSSPQVYQCCRHASVSVRWGQEGKQGPARTVDGWVFPGWVGRVIASIFRWVAAPSPGATSPDLAGLRPPIPRPSEPGPSPRSFPGLGRPRPRGGAPSRSGSEKEAPALGRRVPSRERKEMPPPSSRVPAPPGPTGRRPRTAPGSTGPPGFPGRAGPAGVSEAGSRPGAAASAGRASHRVLVLVRPGPGQQQQQQPQRGGRRHAGSARQRPHPPRSHRPGARPPTPPPPPPPPPQPIRIHRARTDARGPDSAAGSSAPPPTPPAP